MALEGGVMKEPSWTELFDPGNRDHVCEIIFEETRALAVGAKLTLSPDTVRRYLLSPLEAYITEHYKPGNFIQSNIEAANELYDIVHNLVYMLNDGYIELGYENKIREAWIKFVAAGSAYRIYHDLPKEMQKEEYRIKRSAGVYQAARKGAVTIAKRLLSEDKGETYRWTTLCEAIYSEMLKDRSLYGGRTGKPDAIRGWIESAGNEGKIEIPAYLSITGRPKKK
jgi:hypothetical protein